MPRIDIVVETPISRTGRARQIEAMFDVPPAEAARLEWRGDLPIEDIEWSVGLIVGPSGCGKSTILRELFGAPRALRWSKSSVIDDFAKSLSIQDVASACGGVGFNTVPAWLRPFSVLSNGEQFRVSVARLISEADEGSTVAIDEFTSVVDRQVAQIGSHAVQKVARKRGIRMVAASCHYDVIDWLQPDWMFEPATMTFTRRSLRRRPSIELDIVRVSSSAWSIFAPFHYMSADLKRGATCFGAFVDGRVVAFAATLPRPHAPKHSKIVGNSRGVTAPDWQGVGIMHTMNRVLGGAYKATGRRFHLYPAHPTLIRSYNKDPLWRCVSAPQITNTTRRSTLGGTFGGRPNATFAYAGPPLGEDDARRLLG
ncbi:MAG TPA: hypothetical protein VMO47_09110 [Rhodothermales bacterium]|nr:hypothetical protein [Rhodothermales bacterium]